MGSSGEQGAELLTDENNADKVEHAPVVGDVLLELFNIDKWFPGVHALDAVSLDVLAGEVLGLVGENGAGKSTLMAIAAGFLAADLGTVKIAGTELKPTNPIRASELGLAIVYQEPVLLPDLRIDENIYLPTVAAHQAKLLEIAR